MTHVDTELIDLLTLDDEADTTIYTWPGEAPIPQELPTQKERGRYERDKRRNEAFRIDACIQAL